MFIQLPLYFHEIGLAHYSTYIPVAYDLSSIAGSVLLGYLFSKVAVKGKLLAPLMIILTICFFSLKLLPESSFKTTAALLQSPFNTTST